MKLLAKDAKKILKTAGIDTSGLVSNQTLYGRGVHPYTFTHCTTHNGHRYCDSAWYCEIDPKTLRVTVNTKYFAYPEKVIEWNKKH